MDNSEKFTFYAQQVLLAYNSNPNNNNLSTDAHRQATMLLEQAIAGQPQQPKGIKKHLRRFLVYLLQLT
jgi:hypothetical protein